MAKQRIVHGAMIDTVTPDELAAQLATRRTNVVFALGGGPSDRLDEDMPMRGTLRQVTSYRRGGGGDNFIVPADQVIQLCNYDPARIAGTLQNIGANPLMVYLAQPENVIQGNATVTVVGYLGQYGDWDFVLSKDVWCGPVSLWSQLGTTVAWGTH